jgi:Leucine-rich repeat (LRR) protein
LVRQLRHCDNSIGEAIPTTIGSCFALSVINFARNKIASAIPGELGNLPHLNSLHLSRNELSGIVPARLASLMLSYMNLSDNRFTGPLPE